MAATKTSTATRTTAPSPTPRGRPPTPGLREHILAAAVRVFAKHPFHKVRVEDVALEAGVAKGTVYRYFTNKEEVYLASLFQGIDGLQEELDRVAAAEPDPVQRLGALVKSLLEFFWGRDLFFLLLHRNEEERNAPHVRAWLVRRQQFARLIARTLQEGIAAGRIRRVNVRLATEALLGMLRGVHRYRGPGDTPEESANVVVDVFLHGVLARSPSKSPVLFRRKP
ncbi:Fatty acid metabolism regulator protein [bacterium HR30]|nr:Fatty acid metabolism regulator protein [bacterium HR30]